MARAKAKQDGKSGASRKVRSGLSATALLLIGGCAGLALGSLLDGPRVFLRHLLEPSESTEIVGVSAPAAPAELTEYRALQQTRPRAKPPSAQPPPSTPESKAVTPPPVRPEVQVRDLIDEIAAKRAATRSPEAQPQSARQRVGSKVVQIAAYRDIRSAEALARRLRRSGFDSYVSSTRPEGEERFRVRVSPSADTDIGTLASQLRERGFPIWVTTE
jgi:cell division septation protein DedD